MAEADGPDFFRVTGVSAGDVLNIRVAPGADTAKIGEIPYDGDGIRNLGCEGGLSFAEWQQASDAERAAAAALRWCRVGYGGIEGWAAGRYLAEGSAPAEPGAAAHSFGTAAGDATDYWSVFGVEGRLNIRAEPSTRTNVVARVPPGTLLRNFGCEERPDRRWCEIEILDGSQRRGWAAGEFLEPATSALRAGQGIFDAIGHVPCAQVAGQPMQRCEFGAARDGDGSATVVVIRPDGAERALFFEAGQFLSADTAQADGYPEMSARREGDLSLIEIGPERYEIPDAVLFGG